MHRVGAPSIRFNPGPSHGLRFPQVLPRRGVRPCQIPKWEDPGSQLSRRPGTREEGRVLKVVSRESEVVLLVE